MRLASRAAEVVKNTLINAKYAVKLSMFLQLTLFTGNPTVNVPSD